jgi:hypothetical protein
MTPYGLLNWPNILAGALERTSYVTAGSLNFPTMPVNTVELTATDHCAGGLIHFNTRITMTGDDLSAIAPAALCRLICYYVIGQLNDRSLMDACQSLVEIYAWQNRTPSTAADRPTKRLGPAAVKKMERVPFAFREE